MTNKRVTSNMSSRVKLRSQAILVFLGIVGVGLILFERSHIRYERARNEVSASFKEFHGAGATVFSQFGNFWGVRIVDPEFGDEDLGKFGPRLADNHAVEYVSLAGSSLTDRGCATLAKLRHVQVLDLSGTLITTDGVGQIRTLPRLTLLILSKTRVDDRAVAILAGIPSLRSVDLRDSWVTDEGRERLRSLRPDLMGTDQ